MNEVFKRTFVVKVVTPHEVPDEEFSAEMFTDMIQRKFYDNGLELDYGDPLVSAIEI